MALTAEQGGAVITALFAQAAATRAAIDSAWFWHQSDKDAELGAVRTIEDTQIALERDSLNDVLNGDRDEQSWRDGAQRAEAALSYIRGISAHDTIQGLLADTAVATEKDTLAAAGQVASIAGGIASEALSITWASLPLAGKVAVVVVAVGAVVYFAGRASDVVSVARGGA